MKLKTLVDRTYRIGDALLLTGANRARRDMMNHPNTIGFDYLESAKDAIGEKLNKEVLNKIIDDHILKRHFNLPSENELVIHWRLYPRSPVSYDIMNSKVKLFNCKKITVVAVVKDGSTKGRENEIHNFVKKHNAVLKSSMTPDEDFCYCVKAHNFISTIGNFSRLVHIINTGHKEMYNKSFYNPDRPADPNWIEK